MTGQVYTSIQDTASRDTSPPPPPPNMAVSPPSSLASSPHYAAAHLFQPPKSPATTTVTPSFTNTGDYFSSAGSSRKRHRPDSAQAHDQYQDSNQYLHHNIRQTPSTAQCPTPSDAVYGSAYEQDSAFVNERYRLAGGFDTPSLRATHVEAVVKDEHAFRRRLRDDDLDRFAGGECAPSFGPLARERNGAGRMLTTGADEKSRNTWAGLAFGAFGLVGKVFSFGSTVVRGFYAGGGQGYDLNAQQGFGPDCSDSIYGQATATPIPGSWQQDDELVGEHEESLYLAPSVQERPPNKRRQTDRDEWVLVGTPEVESSPKRRISTNNIPRSSLGPSRPTASRASSRRSIAPVPRRTTSYAPANGSPAQRPPLSTGGHSRRASIASPRSPHGHSRQSSGGSGVGQMSPEAERFAKRQAKQERQVDKTMSSMEQRMRDMIRQAQQALGTQYSVEGDDNMDLVDDGFSSDEEW